MKRAVQTQRALSRLGGRSIGPIRFALLSLALVFALGAASALAAETRPYTGVSFGPDGAAGTQAFVNLRSVAVDQTTGNVYAYDGEKVYKFDSSGEPVNFSALSGNAIEGVGGSGIGAEFQIAVAPAGAPGGTAGDIYVANNAIVKVYAPSGTELGTLGEGETCGVAVDPGGHVFIGTYPDTIREYVPSANPPTDADLKATGTAAVSLCNVAADGAGNIYGAAYNGSEIARLEGIADADPTLIEPGGGTIGTDPVSSHLFAHRGSLVAEYDSSGALLTTFGVGRLTVTGGVAINSAADDVYVGDAGSGKVEVFGGLATVAGVDVEAPTDLSFEGATLRGTVNPAGLAISECKFEYGTDASELTESKPCSGEIPTDEADHPVTAQLTGLPGGTKYFFRLSAKDANGINTSAISSFTTVQRARVSTERTTIVGVDSATLEAKVNPGGTLTSYHFEYGTDTSYGNSTPEANLGEGDAFQTIAEELDGLLSGTTYHWRLVVTDDFGPVAGPDHAFTTFTPPQAETDCPNQSFRSAFPSAHLPDCRAYEQASPTDKNGGNIQRQPGLIQASSDGNRISFVHGGGLPSTGGASQLYVATRLGDRWSTDGLSPIAEPGQGAGGIVFGWDEDLQHALTEANPDLYLKDIADGNFEPVGLGSESNASVADFAVDTKHLIFESTRALLPGATSSGLQNLYDLDHGSLTLASRIPAGSATTCDDSGGDPCVPASGAFAGPYSWGSRTPSLEYGGAYYGYYTQNTISDDGSRVVFTTAFDGKLYLREDGTSTTQVSASQRSTPDPNGSKPAAWVASTPDNSKIYFLSCEKLTEDSTAFSTAANSCREDEQGQDLYLYEPDSGNLTDLTVDATAGDPQGADVAGLLGISEDGSYVYFAANGVLAPGASPGGCGAGTTFERNASCNIYLLHNGTITFVSRIEAGNGSDDRIYGGTQNWQPYMIEVFLGAKASRVSENGTLLFNSTQSLTGYDNSCDTTAGGSCAELFRYTPTDEAVHCVSCNPSGAAPRREARFNAPGRIFGAGSVKPILTRNLSSDGTRVFFESEDRLVPEDENDVADVYQWEAAGTGSCDTVNADGGCISILSTGKATRPTFFADASESGDDVFLFTDESLVPADRDELTDAYDVKVGGGLASQYVVPSRPCEGEACKGRSTEAPSESSPATANFSGPGNVTQKPKPCKKGGRKKTKKAKKCTKHKTHRGRHKHHTKSGSRAANNKPGGAK
jgi:hypothetical protein